MSTFISIQRINKLPFSTHPDPLTTIEVQWIAFRVFLRGSHTPKKKCTPAEQLNHTFFKPSFLWYQC